MSNIFLVPLGIKEKGCFFNRGSTNHKPFSSGLVVRGFCVYLVDKFRVRGRICPRGEVGLVLGNEVVKGGLDGHSEDALALDVASGLPRSSLVAKYSLTGQQLTKVLEKPRVAAMVEGYRASIEDSVVRLHHRMAIRSSDILDGIIESALDEGCPHRFNNGRYVLDKMMPNVSYAVTENKHTVDIEVAGQFNEAAEALEAFVARNAKVVVDIKEDDPHLHEGKEFIDERDKGVAGLGEH